MPLLTRTRLIRYGPYFIIAEIILINFTFDQALSQTLKNHARPQKFLNFPSELGHLPRRRKRKRAPKRVVQPKKGRKRKRNDHSDFRTNEIENLFMNFIGK